MDVLVSQQGHQGGERTEDDDADPRGLNADDEVDGLAGQDRAGRGEADVHEHDEHERNDRADDAELGARRDHLRQTQLRTLRRVQRHDDSADDIADEQADDGPQRIGAEDDCQSPVDDRGDLSVGAEPQGELGTWRSVTLGVRHHLDGPLLDPRIGRTSHDCLL